MVGEMLLFSSCIDLDPSPLPTHNQTQNDIGKAEHSKFHSPEIHTNFFLILLSVRWEEEKYEGGVKWKFLEHNGPYFPPEYQPLPDNVHFYYNGTFSTDIKCVRKQS